MRPLPRPRRIALPAFLAVFALFAALLLAGAAPACPSCAGTTTVERRKVWPVVGAFLLVPPALAVGVALAIRRELRNVERG